MYRCLKLAIEGAVVGRAPLLGRASTVVYGTGVGRAFTDMIRKAGVVFTPVTITGGGNQSRGDNGYWNVSKMVLLSERTSSPAGCASSTRRWARS